MTSCRDSEPYVAAPRHLDASNIDAAAHVSAGARPFPPVEFGSQQHENESMDTFFLRRKAHNVKLAARETPEQRQRREQREIHASKNQVPGRKGARVYVWEMSNGHYMRRPAGRSKYEDVWEEYGPEQRCYDSYCDEWDCCEQFGPDAEQEDDGEGNWDPFDEHFYKHRSSVALEPNVDEEAPAEMALEKQSNCRLTKVLSLHSILCLAASNWSLRLLKIRCICDLDAQLPKARQSKLASPSQPLWSLLDFHQETSELYNEWTVLIRREILEHRVYYVFWEKPSTGLYILVESATTALEIVRQGWGPDLRDIMENLLARGMTFMTCCRSTQCSTQLPRSSTLGRSGLGYRPLTYRPNLTDYTAYVSLRDRFFETPRGRAALLFGGIIGRLARAEASVEDVIRGPGCDVLISGISLWDGHSTSAYWDDRLTPDEIDLICGVYHVSTGQFNFSSSQNGKTDVS
ncbi:hypothetical protein C8R43DRAFT_893889 [Mycena crocata]|nr:hypothetical protein C8R43DRAFT_893889 [Mycena crocata]